MIPMWRWFGPSDFVSLKEIRQAGATSVVTALHDIENGQIWPLEAIQQHKTLIENAGLTWHVVESVPVHEDIKRRAGNYKAYIANYVQTLKNLSCCGIDTVCYNFMPLLDWTRTDLEYELDDGSRALRFCQLAFSAFELFILKLPDAQSRYSKDKEEAARQFFASQSQEDKDKLVKTILAGLPGSEESFSLDDFRTAISTYESIDAATLREHLGLFLAEIIPVAETLGLKMAIHPDDPPRPLFGLPRIVSTGDDIEWLVSKVPSEANGITFCTGSYGVREDNDLPKLAERFASKIYFTHLRSTQRESVAGSFHEASHMGGDSDLLEVTRILLQEEKRRNGEGTHPLIPMRPDHGHQIMNDLDRPVKPGYSALGRMKGLAELRGVELALKRYVI